MYKVEAILDKKIDSKTRKQLYLVKWKGYSINQATWQPQNHLSNCKDLVEQFQNQYGGLNTTQFGKVAIPTINREKSNKSINIDDKSDHTRKIKKLHKCRPKIRKNRTQDSVSENQSQQQIDNRIMIDYSQNDKQQIIKKDSSVLKQKSKPIPIIQNKQDIVFHRRESIDQYTLNFRTVSATSQTPKQLQQAINSQKKRQKLREQHLEPKQFEPIIVPTNLKHKKRSKIDKEQNNKPNNQLIQLSGTKIDIIGIGRQKNQERQFYIKKDSEFIWVPRQYLFENYPKQLCKFYEKHLSFL